MDNTLLTDCLPNLNAATIAGKVIKFERFQGKSLGLSFVVGYQKHWTSTDVQEIPIRCYVTGAERVEHLRWLKVGEVVVVHGQVTDKGAVYAHQLDRLSAPKWLPDEYDEFLAGMERNPQAVRWGEVDAVPDAP
jgi:hypothetical protein